MADYFKFDGVDGVDGASQPNPPSWGLDRIDQRADPFLVYGERADNDIGLGLIFNAEAPTPDDGFIQIVTPVLDPVAIGIHRLEIVYL
jgi:hypothetical protein